ncbi:GerW family sporulation protein [Eubacterium xylanophilum]|uniref:GerW family sporulation protein n=1 Tax=Eubacterium xylanophilum TaxID=39497 RepID=UPI00047C4675|nr:GerW family sporulation protein [Eubacterium xylanophilum]
MNENTFGSTVEALFKGMDSFITTKTVIGDAVKFDDGTIILPLVDVSFGVAAGAFTNSDQKKNNGGGGMGGKIQPSAVLVIKDGKTKLVNVKNQDGITKILDMVPDVIDKVKGDKKKDDEDVDVE